MIKFIHEQNYYELSKMMKEYQFYSSTQALDLLVHNQFGILNTQDEKIVSFLLANEFSCNIANQQILTANILNLLTHVDYRNRHFGSHLLEVFDYYIRKKTLLTTILTYNSKYFAKFGFLKLYDIHRYVIPKIELFNHTSVGVYESYTVNDLLSSYLKFQDAFDYSMNRSIEYFQKLITKVNSGNKKIIIYKNQYGVCEGYAIYNTNKNGLCKVEEIIYNNSKSFKNLIYYISEGYFDVVLDVSEFELLHKIFKKATFTKERSMLIKVNHIALFNSIFNTKAKSTFELSYFFKKKIYLQDYFSY